MVLLFDSMTGDCPYPFDAQAVLVAARRAWGAVVDACRGGEARAPSLLLAALVLAFGAPDVMAGPTGQCSDPCLQASRAELRACVSSASGAFADAAGGCLERDRGCIDACRARRQDCRDDTTLGSDVLACQLELAAAKETCRASFPIGSRRRTLCIYRADIAGFRCRRTARRVVGGDLRTCRSDFDQCADACGPGEPPGGVQACRSERAAAHKAELAGCKLVHRPAASACIDKDFACVQDCAEARVACAAPTRAVLDTAIASCSAEQAAALIACATANPAGTPALQACVDAAGAQASTCRDAALAASEPGFTACAGQYVACLRACPAG